MFSETGALRHDGAGTHDFNESCLRLESQRQGQRGAQQWQRLIAL